jgi:Enoyl-CoA hydratase/isomerase
MTGPSDDGAGLPTPSPDDFSLGDVAAVLDDGVSVVVVDLDRSPEAGSRHLPVAYAGVVVGVSRSGGHLERAVGGEPGGSSGHAALSGVDLVLVPDGVTPEGPSPGAAWVQVDDLDAEVSRIREAAAHSPIASVTLMQVLRAGTVGSLGRDLLVESLAYSALQSGQEFLGWLAARPARRAPRSEGDPAVILEREGANLTITLHRPQVRNAYNVALRDGLGEAFELVALDPTIEAVALKGSGPDFCSGGDLDEFGTGPQPAASHLIRSERSPALRLARVADRVTAELHGACVGAGIEIPALAGRIVATADTRVRLPEVAMGLIPGAGGTASLPRRIGRHRTAWLALSGAWLDAETALGWGLVDRLI